MISLIGAFCTATQPNSFRNTSGAGRRRGCPEKVKEIEGDSRDLSCFFSSFREKCHNKQGGSVLENDK
jgi:hypothetical protein